MSSYVTFYFKKEGYYLSYIPDGIIKYQPLSTVIMYDYSFTYEDVGETVGDT